MLNLQPDFIQQRWKCRIGRDYFDRLLTNLIHTSLRCHHFNVAYYNRNHRVRTYIGKHGGAQLVCQRSCTHSLRHVDITNELTVWQIQIQNSKSHYQRTKVDRRSQTVSTIQRLEIIGD